MMPYSKAAIEHLPPPRKQVFALCRREGKSYEEAGAIMRNQIVEI
jgi:DNA-directed RNA polymerase specialized sigma24 family protein